MAARSRQIGRWFEGTGQRLPGLSADPDRRQRAPAFGQYRADPNGGHTAWAIQVLEIEDGRLIGLNSFLDVDRLFPLFGLPLRLPAATS